MRPSTLARRKAIYRLAAKLDCITGRSAIDVFVVEEGSKGSRLGYATLCSGSPEVVMMGVEEVELEDVQPSDASLVLGA